MIDKVVKAIIGEVNNHIKFRFSSEDPKVVIANLVNQDGSVPPENSNKIVCSLINMEQERVLSGGAFMTSGNSRVNPPVNLDLFLMFSSNFTGENYTEGLQLLSEVINFFQGKTVFTPENSPALPANVSKITLNMFNVDLGNLSHLWGALGAKYMPSTIYQVRMVSFFEDRLLEEVQDIRRLGVNNDSV